MRMNGFVGRFDWVFLDAAIRFGIVFFIHDELVFYIFEFTHVILIDFNRRITKYNITKNLASIYKARKSRLFWLEKFIK